MESNWNNFYDMKATLVPYVVEAYGTDPKKLPKRYEKLEIHHPDETGNN